MNKKYNNRMKKPKSVFILSASKGDSHSYIVGVYSSLVLAVDSSYIEEDLIGGKYSFSITEVVLNGSISPSYVSYRGI